MKKAISFLSSMLLTGILLMFFAIAIAYATFIENDYGAITAKILIYNSRWLEILYLLLTVNLVGSMFKYKLVTKKKWSILLFHIAFIVILIGGGITRYFGYEGTLILSEGETKNEITSEATFLQLEASNASATTKFENEVVFSQNTNNKYSKSFDINGHTVKIKLIDFYNQVNETLIEDPNGFPALSLISSDPQLGRMDFILHKGIQKELGKTTYSYGTANVPSTVNFSIEGSEIKVIAGDTIVKKNSGGISATKLAPNLQHQIYPNTMYQIGMQNFMIEKAVAKGNVVMSRDSKSQGSASDAVLVNLTIDNYEKELIIKGMKGYVGTPTIFEKDGVRIKMAYGSSIIPLPFSIQLRDFQMERYPGSNSPSSFASEVTLIDPSKELEMPFRIFMNNILKYGGFRFFQSGFTPDEKGTILSVNSDTAGTSVTYFGYLLMVIGMVLTLLNGNSHFKLTLQKLAKMKLNRKPVKTVLLLLAFSGFCSLANAQGTSTNWKPLVVEEAQINEFSELLTQDNQGRIKPINSVASEILRKLTRKNSFEGMTPAHVILDMSSYPDKWYSIPILKVSHTELQKTLKLKRKFASYNDLVKSQGQGGYLLQNMVNESYRKKPVNRNKLDKEIMNVDERINVLMQVFQGDFLKVFPVPGDANHKWVTAKEAPQFVSGEDATFIKEIFPKYFSALYEAQQSGNYRVASAYLKQIKTYQKKYGEKVIPSESKVKLEVLYNKWNIFSKLAKYYILAGMVLLILHFMKIFNPAKSLNLPINIIAIIILLLFIGHTGGLAIRWYIAGHAPWSNGYESMIYVGWATLLSGLIFMKKSPITLAATTVLAALVLFVAGMNWMNPEITNLVPVLKSYWLIVHVAIITASYGFLALGALMGFLNLNLMIFRNKKNEKRLSFTIKEMSFIIEVTLIIGLIMMTIGSFLGAVWANESWGRYWGWDPKETWSLITVLVYTFALHMRKIEGFRGQFALSTAALVSLSSVIMTFFGVNYYLSGLHSYGQGDPPPIPNGVYIAIAIVAVVITGAYISSKKLTPETSK
ncbi:MAG: cytochrome c biogenesis protein CcsA [Bacteroidetes bacterium]|nr:cytochrome c biogenesis protein CcsA [Bacteroidota bacterium]